MTHKIWISTAVLIASLPGISVAQTPLLTQEQKFGYAMGFRMATQLQQKLVQAGMPLDTSTFAQGVQDALSGAQAQLSKEEVQAVIQIYQTQQFVKQATVAMNNKRAGGAFRKANRAKDGVIETASGLQYRVLEKGVGKHPAATDAVVMHYRGTLVNGEEFDSSYARSEPATFDLNGEEVIGGWREALQLMQKGARWELVLPPELAYGAKGSGDIGPNETLIYEIKLISVK
ncbi:MAG: FKBP-type peptidyl-prolyl cis-trans isomerase [bacterium]|nr:FKBP-type peptidyl-prolyl cis-trans isomerase [bacterium]